MPEKTLIEAIHDAMDEEMARDPSVVLLGEDVGLRGGVFRASAGLIEKYGEARVIDTPLAESSIAGVAIGMALNGLRPIAEMQFADFSFPAFNQIQSEAARMYYRSNGGWKVPMVVRMPYGGGPGVHGALYHSQSVEAFYAHIPGLKVVLPSFPYDAKGMLKAAIRDDDPVIFLEHKKAYRSVRQEVPDGDYTVPLGPAEVRREGRHVTIYSYGFLLHESLRAAEQLKGEGIECTVVDVRSLKPLDKKTIVEAAKLTGRVLIVHEDNVSFGAGAEIAAVIAEEALFHLDAPVRRLCGPDVPGIGFNHVYEVEFTPDAARIAAAARELARY
ncbi:MAG: alpha-ketoacid dehydrogenase subunit beta [Firmicutes bacterium]|nr:alpha-ketoacid dehydrogenase subunit beta [Bacillota bacterium]MBE3590888.1 alpha-ketoacid dehydrogenase subunit beta [Bacillota bacterium]